MRFHQLSVKKADIWLLLSNQLSHFDLSASHCKSTSALLIPDSDSIAEGGELGILSRQERFHWFRTGGPLTTPAC